MTKIVMKKGEIGTGRRLSGFEAGMLIVIQSLVYGFGDPISKIAFEIVPVYSMMTVRYTIAFLFCIAIFGSFPEIACRSNDSCACVYGLRKKV